MDLKSSDPATNTSPPESKTSFALCSFIPPYTSINTRSRQLAFRKDLISDIYGNSLLIFPKENHPTQIPPAVTQLIEWPNVTNNTKFDSILSIGNLASQPDLPQLLLELKHHLTNDSKLYFCERTKVH